MTTPTPTVLVQSGAQQGCLKAYLAVQRKKTAGYLQKDEADQESARFEADVKGVCDMLDEWYAGGITDHEEQRIDKFCALMLGKVQSGKTKHLLSTIAWAVDRGVDAVVVFTGVTNALLKQTTKRLMSDLGQQTLGEMFVTAIAVPTKPKSGVADGTGTNGAPRRGKQAAGKDGIEQILNMVRHRRTNATKGYSTVFPTPVLLTLKHTSRIEHLGDILSVIREEFPDASVLLIDDEADQASPNAKAKKDASSPVYQSISQVRTKAGKHALLSYTATPQAILLNGIDANLRPDRCKLVNPGYGYFGLERLFMPDVRTTITDANDWPDGSDDPQAMPATLRSALAHFAVTMWIRQTVPQAFYALRGHGVSIDQRPSSVQMLIHQSAEKSDHNAVAEIVTKEKNRICDTLMDSTSEAASKFATDELQPALDRIRRHIPDELASWLPDSLDHEHIYQIYNYLQGSTKIVVVNSSSNVSEGFPEDNDAWSHHRGWILIGGNILGRGLTIPQLVTTYFVRAPEKMNFDTVFQQLRFCGYRSEYEHMLSIFVPDTTRQILRYMLLIDNMTWAKATAWDRNKVNLKHNPPAIYFATPRLKDKSEQKDLTKTLEAARSNVIHTTIKDVTVARQLYAAQGVFCPRRAAENARKLRTAVQELGVCDWSHPGAARGGWVMSDDLTVEALRRLLVGWRAEAESRHKLLNALDIFAPEMRELGLHGVPVRLAIRGTDFIDRIADGTLSPEFVCGASAIRRGVEAPSGITARDSLNAWIGHAHAGTTDKLYTAMRMRTYIGDEQRNVQDSLPHESSVIFVEPVHAVANGKDPNSAIHAVGLAMAILAPADFELRYLGQSPPPPEEA